METITLRRRLFTCFLVLLIFLLAAQAVAQTLDFDADRLEVRFITLPDGSQAELLIFAGSPAHLTFDGNTIEADIVEYDRANNLLRIVGFGRFVAEGVETAGTDFVVDLNDERFRANEVVLITDAIDITGIEVTRYPGQLDVLSGAFSPCGRCAQRVEDYGFHAGRLILYPGDRIVAYDVTVLVREVPIFTLPIMVYPLGPLERRPRFTIIQGTETERAEVLLDLPYVVGANAFGLVSLRYFADVTPGEGNFISEGLLGGRVDEHYLGGGILHRYYTDDASGLLEFSYRPRFLGATPGQEERERFLWRWRHETFAELDGPRTNILIERDDARRQRLTEYRLSVENIYEDFLVRFLTQGYIDHEPALGFRIPSYAGRNVPERTFAQLTASGVEGFSFSAGPFVLSALVFDVGFFEDRSNRLNRSALERGPRLSEARLLHSHNLRLNPISPWGGLTIDGLSVFRGQYYTTGERLIQWNLRANVRQNIGTIGNLSMAFQRNTTEGQTPFEFDALTPVTRTDLATALTLRPLPWLAVELRETYVFVDSRRPDGVGPGPLETTVTLFGNLNWINVTLRNAYDFQEGDPGELQANLVLNLDPVRFELTHIQDLSPRPDSRRSDEVVNTSRTAGQLSFQLRPYIQLEARTGYTYDPITPAEDGVIEHWDPLRVVATAGTIEQQDGIPGFRVTYERDLNRGELRLLGLEAAASYDPFELYLRQEMNAAQGRLGSSRYVLTWRNIAELEASGFAILPTHWFGIDLDPEVAQTWAFQLRSLERVGTTDAWRLRYSTIMDPNLLREDGERGGFRGSRLDAFATVLPTAIDPIVFSLDLAANLLVRDDALPITYLQNLSLTLYAEIAETVGLQGSFRYRGLFDGQDISRSSLELANVALTVRVLEELYVSAIFNDIWDFSGNDPAQSPFNLQPLFYVVWDRCCWALYSSWDTATGRFSIGIGAPGGTEGFQQEFETGIRLPGRD